MRTAARLYPDSPAVVNDRALEAIAAGKHAAAVELLEQAAVTEQHPTLVNTLGVAYAGAGEPLKAEKALERAAAACSKAARHKLEQVRGVIDQL